ncbi:transcriptional regulator [Staphylococcus microti]|uniref:Putative phage repressor protein n=1 Tax=Staphylococcus microti TaxID=569857 RepID=A0A0D6XS71_9STAP|nr:S24 family peptidase [Staphylococcus microti]KIX91437.1 transcriptional regulator [Staphylococcus microti]PNZ82498.1 helix-turn-helix domain-containing protein [Staphylococcus microti]PNZ83683.1 helix-turn-helix domain-containing protein [Staphylococcus microti]SUM57011.1 putative phage repressor protein [Staphylococcus microti]
MQTTSDRLKQLMKDRNLRQVDILNMSKPYQKELGIKMSKSHLSQYVNDKSSPDQHKLYLLSKTLDVGEAWLMGYDVDAYRVPDEERQIESIESKISKEVSKLTDKRKKNVYNYVKNQLSLQNNNSSDVIDLDDYKGDIIQETPVYGYASAGTGEQLFDEPRFKVNVKGYIPPHDLALQVNGDSMEPVFRNREIIFVEKTHDIKNGQIGVFIINGEAYVKKVRVEDDRLTLISLNKNYKDLHFYQNEGIQLVGKVIL